MTDIHAADGAIAVAIISGIFAVIGIVIQQRKTQRKLGDPDGSITNMLSMLLQGQTGQDVRLAQLENRTSELQADTSEINAVLDAHDERITKVERHIDKHLTDHSDITQLAVRKDQP